MKRSLISLILVLAMIMSLSLPVGALGDGEPEGASIEITSQPVDYEGQIGDPASFTVGVSASGTDLSYQWQYSSDGGRTWKSSSLPGNKTATLSTELTEARLVYRFRCVISGVYGLTVTSDEVRMIKAAELAITSQPEDYEGSIGDPASFTVEATGAGLSYQWQYSSDGGATWRSSSLTGSKTATLSTELTEARLVYRFRCVVTDAAGNSVTSNIVRMTKAAELAITSQPVDFVGSIGDAVSFTVEAAGSNLTYQWQYSND